MLSCIASSQRVRDTHSSGVSATRM
jgi:hypothetical protein